MSTLSLPKESGIDYAQVAAGGGDARSLRQPEFLHRLSTLWLAAYKAQTGRRTNVTEMWFNGFSVLVDLEGSDHADGRGPQPPGVFPRTIVAYGISKPVTTGRKKDDQRLRGIVPTEPTLVFGRDKGHFIAHSIGGKVIAAETNVFAQRRDLNRGWSAQGKLFRQMERFAAENSATPYFHRPVYLGESDVPDFLEVGVIRPDSTIWVEVFDNRDAA